MKKLEKIYQTKYNKKKEKEKNKQNKKKHTIIKK